VIETSFTIKQLSVSVLSLLLRAQRLDSRQPKPIVALINATDVNELILVIDLVQLQVIVQNVGRELFIDSHCRNRHQEVQLFF
jgi:hypothetical protein